MTEKLEGTLVLDGLLEGNLPEAAPGEDRVREWVRFTASLGLPFSLETDASHFSLLGESRPVQVERLGTDPSAKVAEVVRELLKVFAPEERRRLFSTLRSTEFRPGLEVQAIYLIGPTGDIEVREQSVSAETKAPPRPLTRREKLRLAGLGLGVALLIVAVSAIFVNYRALWASVVEAVRPLDPAKIEADDAVFQDYFTVEKRAIGRDRKSFLLTLQRTKRFPLQDADIERELARPGLSLAARLALDALARGYVRCEYFDKDGEFLGFTSERIQGLRQNESIELVLPLPRERTLARIAITY